MPDEPKEREKGARRPLELFEVDKTAHVPQLCAVMHATAGGTVADLRQWVREHGCPGTTYRIVRPIGQDMTVKETTVRKVEVAT